MIVSHLKKVYLIAGVELHHNVGQSITEFQSKARALSYHAETIVNNNRHELLEIIRTELAVIRSHFYDYITSAIIIYNDAIIILNSYGDECYKNLQPTIFQFQANVGLSIQGCTRKFNNDLTDKCTEVFNDSIYRQYAVNLKRFIFKESSNFNIFQQPDVTIDYLNRKFDDTQNKWSLISEELNSTPKQLYEYLLQLESNFTTCMDDVLAEYDQQIDLFVNEIENECVEIINL